MGGIIGLALGSMPISRRSLEDLALGTTAGGFFGCLTAFLVYLLVRMT